MRSAVPYLVATTAGCPWEPRPTKCPPRGSLQDDFTQAVQREGGEGKSQMPLFKWATDEEKAASKAAKELHRLNDKLIKAVAIGDVQEASALISQGVHRPQAPSAARAEVHRVPVSKT